LRPQTRDCPWNQLWRNGFGVFSKPYLEGQAASFILIADSSNTISFQFYLQCGGTLAYELQCLPDFIGVPVGGFAVPGFTVRKVSVYEGQMHLWVSLSRGVEPRP